MTAVQLQGNSAPHQVSMYPYINRFGCYKTNLLFAQLQYWFEKYPQGFCKFFEPCNHPLYRKGESWSEELGFSRITLKKAFSQIGEAYKSKTAFMNEDDPFHGKHFAYYQDRALMKTVFIRNPKPPQDFVKEHNKPRAPKRPA